MTHNFGNFGFDEMTAGMFARVGYVPEHGFTWADDVVAARRSRGRRPSRPWLITQLSEDAPGSAATFPLRAFNLHREFAKLEPTPSGIARFAGRWGWLGAEQQALVRPASSQVVVAAGEALDFWVDAINELGQLVALWDLVRVGDVDALRPYVHWEASPPSAHVFVASAGTRLLPAAATRMRALWSPTADAWKQRVPTRVARQAAKGIGRDVRLAYERVADSSSRLSSQMDRWKPGDVIEPARYFVFDRTNVAMRGTVSPAVLPYRDNAFVMWPTSLLGSLYCLLALELAGRLPEIRSCAFCGLPFVPRRANQAYCGDPCRKGRYRRRGPLAKRVGGASTARPQITAR